MIAPGGRRWCVYRCYDGDGQLLYIGSTGRIGSRLSAHRQGDTPVGVELTRRMTRYTVDLYPHRQAALEAERVAIYCEAPLLNVQNQRPAARGLPA